MTSPKTGPPTRDRASRKIEGWARRGPGTAPVAAATVILVRDGTDGIETLMLRRNSKLDFVGGMWVFPGGRVDPGDQRGLDPADEIGAARRAAVREAAEEAGLQVGETSLVPFSHWTPPPITPKRFLTWFFIAPAPAGVVEIDRGEIHDHAWMRPVEALHRRDAADIELAPPTFVSLSELAQRGNVAEAVEAALARTPERFETQIAVTDEGPVALWHGDAGYEAADADIPGARHRLRMLDSGWRYERSAE